MYIFIAKRKPRSINARTSHLYRDGIAEDFRQAYPEHHVITVPMYSRIYYFHSEPTTLDADNISKPTLDALRGVAFEDDRLVKHRSCSIISIMESGLFEFDLTNVPDKVAADLIESLSETPHVLYIEIGKYSKSLITFGGVQNE